MPIYKAEGKKNGLQKYNVRINYTDLSGKNHQLTRTAYGLAEAKELEAKLTREVKEDGISSRVTLQALYDEYIQSKKSEVRETSLDKTKQRLKHYILPFLGNTRIDKLNSAALQKWKLSVIGLGLAISTQQNIYGEFRAMLNYAVKVEYLQRNPLSLVGNFKDPYEVCPSEKIQYYTASEFKSYIQCARKSAATLTDWGFYVFFNIAFYTGMRKGEINALKWTDIEGDFIHVRRSIAQKLKGEDRETPPKNKSSYRTLQMPLPLIVVLNEHKKRQKNIGGFSEDLRVCGGVKCLRDTSIAKKNEEYAKAAGVKRIRVHDFRHSHASLLANEGINIQEIARRLGHSKIETTWNTYSHLYPREEERAVRVLNAVC